MRFSIEESDDGGEITITRAAKIVQYLHLAPGRGTGMIGQPSPHWYFHRPLHVLLAPAFAAGLVLDGLDEPAFPEAPPTGRPFDWAAYPEIPPVLALRFRVR